MKKKVDVKDKYSHELNDMNYILEGLESGRYYENSGAKMDGIVATNIQKLRKSLNDLINKIEYNKESVSEELGEIVSKLGI